MPASSRCLRLYSSAGHALGVTMYSCSFLLGFEKVEVTDLTYLRRLSEIQRVRDRSSIKSIISSIGDSYRDT